MNNLDRASIAQLHQKLDALTTEDTVSSAAAARRAAQSEAQRSMQEHITSSKVMEDAAAVNEALAQARLQRKEARERLERQLLAPQRSAATADVAALPTSSSSVGGSFTRARTLLERERGKSANNLLQSRPSSSTQSFADTTPAASAVGGRRLPPIAMHREALEDAAHCRHPTQLRPGTCPTVGHSSTPSAAEAAVGGVILRHDAFTEEYDNGGRTALSGTLPPPASSLASTRRALSLTSYGEQVLKPFVQKKVVLGSLVPELTSLHDQIRALEEESLRAARVAEQKCRADELRKQYRTSRPDGDQDDEDEQENNTRKDGGNKSEQLSVKQREMFLRQALERGKANQENLKALRAEAERHAADIVARNEAHIRQLEETRAAALVAERYEAEYQQMRSELRKAVLMEVEEHLAQEDDDDEENEELREIAQRGSIPSRGVKGAANVFSARGDQATAASLSQSEPASSDVSIAPSPVSNLSTELQPGHSQDDQGLPLAPLNAAAAPVIGTAGPLAERKRRAGSPDFLAYIAEFGFLLPFEKNSELETPEFLLTPSHPLFQLEQQQDTLDAPSAANGEVMDPLLSLAISEDDCFRLLSEPNRSLNDLLSAVKHCDPLFSFCTHPRRCPPYEKRIQRLWDAKPETPTAPSVASVAAAPTGPKKQKESSAPKNAVLSKKHDEPEEVASGLLTLAPAASSQSPQDATTTMQQSSGTEAPSHGTKKSPVPLTITTVPKASSTTATTRSPTSRQSPRAPITSLSPTGLSTPPMFLSPQARRPSTLTFASMQPPIDSEERPFSTSYPFSERGASTSAGPFGHKNIVTDALEELRDELHTLVAEGIRHRNSVMRSSMIRANSVTGSLASAGVDRESSLARRASLAGLPMPSGGPAPFLTPEWSQQYSSEGVGGGNAASLGASMTNTVSQEDTDTLLRTYGDSDTPRLQDALAGSQKGNNKHFGGSYPPTSASKPLSQQPLPLRGSGGELLDSSLPLSKQPSGGGGGGSSVPLPSSPPPHVAAAVPPPPPPETLAPRVFRNPETGALDDVVVVAGHHGELILAGATGSLGPSSIDQTLFYAAKTLGHATEDGGDASSGGALQTEISGFMATSQSFFLAASSHPLPLNSAAAPPTIVMGSSSSSSSSPHIVRVTEATGQRVVTADGVSIRLNDDERPLTNNNNIAAAEIEPLSRERTALPLPDETEAEQARRGASSSSSSPQRSSLLTVEQTVKRSIARRNLRKIVQNTTLFGGNSKPSTVDEFEEL